MNQYLLNGKVILPMKSLRVKTLAIIYILIMLCFFTACSGNDVLANQTTKEHMQLNTDLLADLDLTFSQIKESRGDVKKVERNGLGGGFGYEFDSGYGQYVWYNEGGMDSDLLDEHWDNLGHDWIISNNNYTEVVYIHELAPRPKGDRKCSIIQNIPFDELFKDLDFPTTISDIEEKYQITHVESSFDAHDRVFYSSFLSGNVHILIMASNTIEEFIEAFNMQEDSRLLMCSCRNSPEAWKLFPCTCGYEEFKIEIAKVLIFEKNSTITIRVNTVH